MSRARPRSLRLSALSLNSNFAVVAPRWRGLEQRRWYVTRDEIHEHMKSLQALANTPEPAKQKWLGFRNTKIVCTLGPKVANEKDIGTLFKAGLNVARFNFSHGEYSWFAETIATIRKVKKEQGRYDVAIALDTKGPEIRTGQLAQGSPVGAPGFALKFSTGDSVVFSSDASLASAGTEQTVYVDYTDIGATLKPGDPMMIDDGLLEFRVTESGDGWVRAEALNNGLLGERKGVNLPGALVTLPAVSVKDKADLQFGAEQGVDYIFASFVRKREHVDELREALGPAGKDIKIISKIENLEGVQNFDEILAASDGIMVARGDLGIEIPAPKVVVAQKLMIAKCNLAGKPVICATQMLESMVNNPRPTRAEVSDVANAVMDGADAVMLSGETAKGNYPKEAVKTMATIACEAEAAIYNVETERRQQLAMPRPAPSMEAVAAAAVRTAQDQGAQLLVVVTETAAAPLLAAKYRPTVPILAVCPTEDVARRCALLRGVTPVIIPWHLDGTEVSVDKVIADGLAIAKKKRIANDGRAVVLHDSNISDAEEMSDWVMRVVVF